MDAGGNDGAVETGVTEPLQVLHRPHAPAVEEPLFAGGAEVPEAGREAGTGPHAPEVEEDAPLEVPLPRPREDIEGVLSPSMTGW